MTSPAVHGLSKPTNFGGRLARRASSENPKVVDN